MVVADMELAETVLHNAGGLEQDLVELLVLSAGQCLDGIAGDLVIRRAQARLDMLARAVEPFGGHDDVADIAAGLRLVRVGRGHAPRLRQSRIGYCGRSDTAQKGV